MTTSWLEIPWRSISNDSLWTAVNRHQNVLPGPILVRPRTKQHKRWRFVKKSSTSKVKEVQLQQAYRFDLAFVTSSAYLWFHIPRYPCARYVIVVLLLFSATKDAPFCIHNLWVIHILYSFAFRILFPRIQRYRFCCRGMLTKNNFSNLFHRESHATLLNCFSNRLWTRPINVRIY